MEKKNFVLEAIQNNTWNDVVDMMISKKIKVKTKGDVAIFNYNIDADFNDPIVCQSRGIIIDFIEKKVVCRAFDKFFNYSEPYAATIDWASASVQEKIDGSIVKLYHYKGEWRWATNGMIDASDANIADGLPVKSFFGIIRKCINYQDIIYTLNSLDKNYTYIFELVSPYNKIVVRYNECKLYHIGTRNNLTGQEYDIDIGVEKPKRFPLSTLEQCIIAASVLNKGNEHVETEGFVVVDQFFNRVKIKSPEYVTLHHNVFNHILSVNTIVNLLCNEDFNTESFLIQFPEYREQFNVVQDAIDSFYDECTATMIAARNLYDKCGDGKNVWESLENKQILRHMAMKSLDNIFWQKWQEMTPRKVAKIAIFDGNKRTILSYVKEKLRNEEAE